ncbi:MAG TPA: tetratricopeptide repeat protein, partial [Candidatus Hydrogenedentes bacterium]|nr:tetratricopeptide repeat protein [Candidatus Hydrogenedentota bacterium]HPG69379.1 tetratricopeptide repeat protein [Candidatus Hydrogenedentota bacterium]
LRKSLDAEARVDRWRALCTTYPDLAETHVFLAQALEDAGRADEAFEHYGQAQALSPGAGLVRALCALALARAGRVDEARPMLERSLEPIGDRPNLRAEITGVLEELGAGAAATEE